ncbi:hypothetical protein Btru_041659, partial [Bulinus truncatus]
MALVMPGYTFPKDPSVYCRQEANSVLVIVDFVQIIGLSRDYSSYLSPTCGLRGRYNPGCGLDYKS